MKKLKALILEDEFIAQATLKDILEDTGLIDVVGISSSGDLFLSMFFKLNPDIIFLDIRVDGTKNGIRVAKEIFEEKPIPIVFLTAFIEEEHENLLNTPYTYFLPKPYNVMLIKQIIQEQFNISNSERFNRKVLPNGPKTILPGNDILWIKPRETNKKNYQKAGKRKYIRVKLNELVYVQSEGKVLKFYTTLLCDPFQVTSKIGDFYRLLINIGITYFVDPHISYKVNKNFIVEYSGDFLKVRYIIQNGGKIIEKRIPIASDKGKDILDNLLL